MSSHIRYRGFQGDIRQFTAPVSFDPEGMAAILGLSEFIPWRDQGGLIVSDALGVPAVRKYFDPTLSTFPHRRIAKESFLAGNDLLILAQFDLNNYWPDQYENIKDTVVFFRSEYRRNPAFAARVDEAVSRILRLKLDLYPEEVYCFTPKGDLVSGGFRTVKVWRLGSDVRGNETGEENVVSPAVSAGRGGWLYLGDGDAVALIDGAESRLDIMNPYLTDGDVISRIVAAAERGELTDGLALFAEQLFPNVVAYVNVQDPPPLSVPALSVAPAGTPVISIDSVSLPSVSSRLAETAKVALCVSSFIVTEANGPIVSWLIFIWSPDDRNI